MDDNGEGKRGQWRKGGRQSMVKRKWMLLTVEEMRDGDGGGKKTVEEGRKAVDGEGGKEYQRNPKREKYNFILVDEDVEY